MHRYATAIHWSAQESGPTTNYRSYRRDHAIRAGAKPQIPASSDPTFRGNAERYNPEELFVASLSSCHMLWYLHLCATNGVVVLDYRDEATGTLQLNAAGSGEFVRVELRPYVTVAIDSDPERALALHEEAHRLCFLARSVNFPVEVSGEVTMPLVS